MKWQPIETAPKDGTRVDIWVVDEDGNGWREPAAYYVKDRRDEFTRYLPDGESCREWSNRDGWWAPNHDYDGEDGWCDMPRWFNAHPRQRRWVGIKATHWMPLPEAPE